MKRLSIIFNIALLSLLIIMVGGGVTLMRCNHTGSMSVVQLSVGDGMSQQEAEAEDESATMQDCCTVPYHGTSARQLPCMDYTLLSLQPTILSNGFTFSHAPLCMELPPYLETALSPCFATVSRRQSTECSGRHGPPRRYLRLITVLQI